MSIVTLRLPEVKVCESSRPKRCQICGGETFQRWGGAIRKVRDPHIREVLIYRYRCCTCRHTTRQYPSGIDQASQTKRMRALAAIGWILGMSYRGQTSYLSGFGIELGRMSIWRDVQERAKGWEKERHWKPVRVLGVDGAYLRGWGETQAVMVAVDMGTGDPVTVGYLDEKDPQAVKKFLEPLMQRLGVSVIVTDDLASYKQAADQLGLEHQVCQFHLRRWVGRTLRDLKQTVPAEKLGVIEEIKMIIAELPLHGDRRLLELWRQIPETRQGRNGSEYSPLDQLRFLLVRLAQDWARYRVFDWQKDVPWTNNPTEQAIGRMKMRARAVRGYKTWAGMKSGLITAGIGVV
jgi:transposase-like protein